MNKPIRDQIEVILFHNLKDEDNRPYTIADITNEILPLFKQLEARLAEYESGHKGACPTCEPVGILNKQLEARLREAEEVIGLVTLERINDVVTHCHWCRGYCLSNGDEFCNCDQKPLLDLVKRAREYLKKHEVKL